MAILATESKYTEEQRKYRQAASAAWKARNPEKVKKYVQSEKVREYRKKWRQENKEKCKAYTDKWRSKPENKEKLLATLKAWKLRNKDIVAQHDFAKQHKRRAKKKSAVHPMHDFQKEKELVRLRIKLTKTTGIKWAVDHIIPLAAGGYHHHENLQVIPFSLNSVKSSNPFWRMDGYRSWAEVDPALWPDSLVQRYNKILQEESNCLS